MVKRKRRKGAQQKETQSIGETAVQELEEAVKKEMLQREKTCSDIIDQVLEKHKCGLFCSVRVSGDGRLYGEPHVVARREK